MLSKFAALQNFMGYVDSAVFAISESWLTDSVPTDAVTVPGFRAYRTDRGSRAGGLLLYVRCNLISCKLDLVPGLNYQHLEQLWVLITFANKYKAAIAVIYRPKEVPTQSMGDLDKMVRHVQLNFTNNIIITGDFNIDTLEGAPTCGALKNLLNDLSLIQLINKPTRVTEDTESCIDLIIVNDNLPIVSSDVIECSLSDHFATTCTVNIRTAKSTVSRRVVRDFNSLDGASFARDLADLDWNPLYSLPDVNQKVDYFNTSIMNIFDTHAPYKVVLLKGTKCSQPWFTDTLRQIRRTKIKAFNRYKHTQLPSHRRFYCNVRNYYNFAIREEKKQFYHNTILSNIDNPKKLWPVLRNCIPNSLSKKSAVSASDYGYDADSFNNYFTDSVRSVITAANPLVSLNLPPIPITPTTFSYQPVSMEVIRELLFGQKPSAIGSDLISAKMLQMCASVCIGPLTHIINFSFEKGEVPDKWKTSVSVPIPKNSNSVSVSDFRNISLQCVQSKIAEKALQDQMSSFVDGILPPQQSAFRQNHSTTTVCVAVLDDILRELDEGNNTALVMLDMTKAFDTLEHSLIIAKLRLYGFDDVLVSWFASYLSHRRQYVRLDDFHSSGLREVSSGVPQGSILGPILFNLYIADLSQVIKHCKFYFYADDIQIYIPFDHQNAMEQVAKLNCDLQSVSEWATNNGLRLNPAKSQATLFGTPYRLSVCDRQRINIILAGEALTVVDNPKNLGIRFDGCLAFQEHVDYLCRVSYLRLKLLRPLRQYFTGKIRLLLVESLILSLFNYGDCVYGPCLTQENKRRLQVCQNYCIRFVTTIPYADHVTPYIRSLNLLKLCERRFLHYVLLICKTVSYQKPSYLYDKIEFRSETHSFNLRQNFTVTVPAHNTTRFESSFSYLAAYVFNKIGPTIFGKSLQSVKHLLRDAVLGDRLLSIDVKKF